MTKKKREQNRQKLYKPGKAASLRPVRLGSGVSPLCSCLLTAVRWFSGHLVPLLPLPMASDLLCRGFIRINGWLWRKRPARCLRGRVSTLAATGRDELRLACPPGRTCPVLSQPRDDQSSLCGQYVKMMGLPPAVHLLARLPEHGAKLTVSCAALALILGVSGVFTSSSTWMASSSSWTPGCRWSHWATSWAHPSAGRARPPCAAACPTRPASCLTSCRPAGLPRQCVVLWNCRARLPCTPQHVSVHHCQVCGASPSPRCVLHPQLQPCGGGFTDTTEGLLKGGPWKTGVFHGIGTLLWRLLEKSGAS